MTYDYYGYKSILSTYSVKEAREKLDNPNNFSETTEELRTRKYELANLLKKCSPSFEILIFDYAEIARLRGISVREAQVKLNYIELSAKDGDLTIIILDDLIQFSVPLISNSTRLQQVFESLLILMKEISCYTGYIMYDPQSDEIFDPMKIESIPRVNYYRTFKIQEKVLGKKSCRKSKLYLLWRKFIGA